MNEDNQLECMPFLPFLDLVCAHGPLLFYLEGIHPTPHSAFSNTKSNLFIFILVLPPTFLIYTPLHSPLLSSLPPSLPPSRYCRVDSRITSTNGIEKASRRGTNKASTQFIIWGFRKGTCCATAESCVSRERRRRKGGGEGGEGGGEEVSN